MIRISNKLGLRLGTTSKIHHVFMLGTGIRASVEGKTNKDATMTTGFRRDWFGWCYMSRLSGNQPAWAYLASVMVCSGQFQNALKHSTS